MHYGILFLMIWMDCIIYLCLKAVHAKKEGIGFRNKLLASTDPIVALKGKTVTGGRINAAKALE